MVAHTKKRRHPKLSERWPVTVLTQDCEANGETRSLTVEGVFFLCPERLKEGELCHMKISLPEKPLELKGELAWSNVENFKPDHAIPGMGYCFMRISTEDRGRLEDAIVTCSERRKPPARA